MAFFKNEKKTTLFSTKKTQQTLHKNLGFLAKEQYRILRTNVLFTLPEDIKCPILGITSSIKGEGKSTTSINLSYVLAEQGYKVLLIDGDLRIPSLAKKLEIKSNPGLTDLLINNNIQTESFKSTISDNLYIVPSGEIPPNPSELLGSTRMKRVIESFKDCFDYIIVDLPPINLVTDAISISPLLTGLILVVRANYVTKNDLDQSFQQMKLANANVLGYVMTGRNETGKSYGKYKHSYYYKNEYRQEDSANKKSEN